MTGASGWASVAREDGETIGYLEPLADDWSSVRPRNRLGHPVGDPSAFPEAEELLLERGISELAEAWRLDGGDVDLSIAEVSADGIVVRDALRAKALVPSERIVVPWPDVDGRLTRA